MKYVKIFEDLFRTDNTIKNHERLIIKSLIDFFKNEFSIEFKSTVRKTNNKLFIGDISLNEDSLYKNKFKINLNSNQSFITMIKSLIHELIHVKQVVLKDLKVSEDFKNILWKENYSLEVKEYNKIVKSKNLNLYNNLPWEADVISNIENIYDKYKSSSYYKNLKGVDINLDFIIDNLD